MSLYQLFSERTRANKPVALATVIDGPNIGAMLLVTPENEAQGTLGNAELDRVVARDTQGELEAGRTSVRHYGPQGQTTPEDLVNTPTVRVFIDAFSPPPTMVIFGTRADVLPEDYRRYLVNSFREHFTMPGVPIRLQLRSPRNPYAEDEG